jgi:hypothetical protein
MMCDATLRVHDAAGLTEALNDGYDRDDDEPDGTLVWFEHVIVAGMQRIRAHLEGTVRLVSREGEVGQDRRS